MKGGIVDSMKRGIVDSIKGGIVDSMKMEMAIDPPVSTLIDIERNQFLAPAVPDPPRNF
jgi:hypothetical protein